MHAILSQNLSRASDGKTVGQGLLINEDGLSVWLLINVLGGLHNGLASHLRDRKGTRRWGKGTALAVVTQTFVTFHTNAFSSISEFSSCKLRMR